MSATTTRTETSTVPQRLVLPAQQRPLGLEPSGRLDALFDFEELTPAIGRVYPTLQLHELIEHPEADTLVRDLAITISRRGVVFFKSQEISPEQQKWLTNRLGELTGKPSTSGLHVHPVFNPAQEHRGRQSDEGEANKDAEISVISSRLFDRLQVNAKSDADEWHSDIAFEPVPADYTSLRVHTLPSHGGDTLWSSGYELYDKLSPAIQRLVDSLDVVFEGREFVESARTQGYSLHPGPRGAAENVGEHLSATHPAVRTNPVTGWKTLFGGMGTHFSHFPGLSTHENRSLAPFFRELVSQTHTAQVRYKWGKNDLAIWDNRSTFHAATPDYQHLGPRAGVRAVSCGEVPYLDERSESRREALARV